MEQWYVMIGDVGGNEGTKRHLCQIQQYQPVAACGKKLKDPIVAQMPLHLLDCNQCKKLLEAEPKGM